MKTAHDIILPSCKDSMAGIADTFKVATDATKVEIAQAVKRQGLKVSTISVRGRFRRQGSCMLVTPPLPGRRS